MTGRRRRSEVGCSLKVVVAGDIGDGKAVRAGRKLLWPEGREDRKAVETIGRWQQPEGDVGSKAGMTGRRHWLKSDDGQMATLSGRWWKLGGGGGNLRRCWRPEGGNLLKAAATGDVGGLKEVATRRQLWRPEDVDNRKVAVTGSWRWWSEGGGGRRRWCPESCDGWKAAATGDAAA